MTDAPVDERAARLARLRERRGQQSMLEHTTPAPAEQPTEPVVLPAPQVTLEQPVVSSTKPGSRRRRSPATNAKIVTVGASATAMFGMIAGYGIADGLTSQQPEPAAPALDPAVAAPAAGAEVPPASPTTTPATAPPQVIVIVVDAATGQALSTTTGSGDLADDLAAAGVTPETTSASAATPAESTTATPVPVAAPAAVDLAVPAPPTPLQPVQQTAPAAAPAPQTAPQPQARTSGS